MTEEVRPNAEDVQSKSEQMSSTLSFFLDLYKSQMKGWEVSSIEKQIDKAKASGKVDEAAISKIVQAVKENSPSVDELQEKSEEVFKGLQDEYDFKDINDEQLVEKAESAFKKGEINPLQHDELINPIREVEFGMINDIIIKHSKSSSEIKTIIWDKGLAGLISSEQVGQLMLLMKESEFKYLSENLVGPGKEGFNKEDIDKALLAEHITEDHHGKLIGMLK